MDAPPFDGTLRSLLLGREEAGPGGDVYLERRSVALSSEPSDRRLWRSSVVS